LQIAQENDQQDCAAVILQNQIANLDEQAQAQGIEEAWEALEYLPEDMDIDQVMNEPIEADILVVDSV
jgi:hypothetical protein